jgi:hypothetical protein
MWGHLRNYTIGAVIIGLILFGMGFAVTTPAKMPSYALVFVDDEHGIFLAPECVPEWRRRPSEHPVNLRRSFAGEAHQLRYNADEKCTNLGAFAPAGPSLSRRALESAGLIGPQKQWWDAPYRTEQGMVYPPATHA